MSRPCFSLTPALTSGQGAPQRKEGIRPMDTIFRGFLVPAFLLTCVPAFAGIADSPLPVLQAGVTTQLLYSVPGVMSDAGHSVATYFACTSTSTSSMVVGVEL